MLSSQQILGCLLAGLISGFPLILFANNKEKAEPEKSPEKKIEKPGLVSTKQKTDLVSTKQKPGPAEAVEESIVVKSSSDSQKEPEEPEEPDEDRLFRKDVILQINEIIKKSQEDYPALAKTLSNEKKHQLLKAVVNTLDRGMEYISATDFNSRKVIDNSDIEPQSAIMVASNQVLYIRLDSFSNKSLKQLKADCESSSQLAKQPLGIIIDLRNAQCFNYKAAIHALGLFATPRSLQKYNLRTNFKQTLKKPVILLTGGETSGAAEVFAKLLIDMKRSISLGEKTAGIPFKKRKVTLSNGDFLMIPQIPDLLADILPESVKPSIRFTPYPQLSYKKISGTAGADKEDKCIQRAVELIICLDALSK